MRLKWIDGLKGVASILIFLHHFILAFAPALYYGSGLESRLFANEGNLAQSPLLFFVGGHFLVSLFLMLSGLVLTLQVFRINTLQDLFKKIIERYLRLAIPVFVISLIVYGMLKYGLFYHNDISKITGSPWLSLFYQAPLSLRYVFETSFYSVWFMGNDAFSTAFWMLTYLFYGSLLTYVVIYVSRNTKPQLQLIIILCILIITILMDSYLVNFGFGMVLGWIIRNKQNIFKHRVITFVILMIGILFAGYPQGVVPTNFYESFLYMNKYLTPSIHIHALSAFLIILSLNSLDPINSLFEYSYFQKLGRISYAIYLTHIPILFSLSSILFRYLHNVMQSYPVIILVVFTISLTLVIFVSSWFNKYVILPIYRISKKISSE